MRDQVVVVVVGVGGLADVEVWLVRWRFSVRARCADVESRRGGGGGGV